MFHSAGRKFTKVARSCFELQILYGLQNQIESLEIGITAPQHLQARADDYLQELNAKWPDLFNLSGFYMTAIPQTSQTLNKNIYDRMANEHPERVSVTTREAE